MQVTARVRWSLLLVAGLALVAGAAWTLFGGSGGSTASAQPAAAAKPTLTSTTPQRGGMLKIQIGAAPPSIPIGVTHAWTVSVSSAGGDPVGGCKVEFDGSMPEHGHGLPTAPRVSAGPNSGQYRVEGVRFSMPGYWRLDVRATCGDSALDAAFDLRL
jgi:hypothetical protein